MKSVFAAACLGIFLFGAISSLAGDAPTLVSVESVTVENGETVVRYSVAYNSGDRKTSFEVRDKGPRVLLCLMHLAASEKYASNNSAFKDVEAESLIAVLEKLNEIDAPKGVDENSLSAETKRAVLGREGLIGTLKNKDLRVADGKKIQTPARSKLLSVQDAIKAMRSPLVEPRRIQSNVPRAMNEVPHQPTRGLELSEIDICRGHMTLATSSNEVWVMAEQALESFASVQAGSPRTATATPTAKASSPRILFKDSPKK